MTTPGFQRASRAVLLAVLIWLRLHAAAATPAFKSLRYEEDYSHLREPGTRTAWLDRVKHVPILEDIFLSLGGEARARYEYYRDALWGEGPQDGSGNWLHRALLHADARLGSKVRVFGQLRAAGESGRVGGPRATDEDETDIHQAFFDVAMASPADRSITLRIGRQEIAFGSSRLVSVRDGPNLRRSFDGLRVILEHDDTRIDFFALDTVDVRPGAFNDRGDTRHRLWGIYAVRPFRGLSGGKLDLYYLGRLRDAARYDQGTAREERHSFGARLSGSVGRWDGNWELVAQTGRFGGQHIAAWTIATDTGYTMENVRWRPRFGLRADVASGDRSPQRGRLETFNALFPNGSYFSESALIGPANLIDLHPSVSLRPTQSFALTVAWDFFWWESTRDGIYGTATNLVRSGQQTSAWAIGDQVTGTLTWQPNRHWNVTVCGARFAAGEFIRESGASADVTFFATWTTFRF